MDKVPSRALRRERLLEERELVRKLRARVAPQRTRRERVQRLIADRTRRG